MREVKDVRALIEVGIVPLKKFVLRSKVSRILIEPNMASDMVPDKTFENNSIEYKDPNALIVLGIEPVRKFECKLKVSIYVRLPILAGIAPVKEFEDMLSANSDIIELIVLGIVPLI